MLPVSAWPPGPPGASLSPFGKPRSVNVGSFSNGFVIPKGAWIVNTGSNQVVMFTPAVAPYNPCRAIGTGYLPGQIPPTPPPGCGPPLPTFYRYNDTVEWFRAQQRATGNTDPPIRPLAGFRPPNWFGWRYVSAPRSLVVPAGQSGLVVADGQNVVITGSGCATITQAYSV